MLAFVRAKGVAAAGWVIVGAAVAVLSTAVARQARAAGGSPAYLSAEDLKTLTKAPHPVILPPTIPSHWNPVVVLPVRSGAWGVVFGPQFGGFSLSGGAPGPSYCSYLHYHGYTAGKGFTCHALRARGVWIAEDRGRGGGGADFWWVKCHTGFSMGTHTASNKPGARLSVKALINSLIPAGVGPSATSC